MRESHPRGIVSFRIAIESIVLKEVVLIPWASLLLVLVTVLPEGLLGGRSLSYRNLTHEETSREFYRSAAQDYEGKRVHVHVPAHRILGVPKRTAPGRAGGTLYVFENQSVPLVVDPRSVYYRKIVERVRKGERVCVKGEVKKEPKGGKDRLALWVHSVKRAHDGAKKGSGSKSGSASKGAGKKPK